MWRHAAPAYGFECRDRDGRWGNGVRTSRVWAGLLGIEHAVIEKVEFDAEQQLLVAHVRGQAPDLRRDSEDRPGWPPPAGWSSSRWPKGTGPTLGPARRGC